MSSDPAGLRLALVKEIATEHPALEPEWRDAVATVPRELFLGSAAFRLSAAGWESVRRTEVGEDEWLRMVHSDRTWVTQVDGKSADDAVDLLTGSPTSSATLPSLVARTAQLARLRPGQKVLEVGTGTGYSTAVLCRRLGAGNVVSIEYDAVLAASAAAHLAEADTHRRSRSATACEDAGSTPTTTRSSPPAPCARFRPRGSGS